MRPRINYEDTMKKVSIYLSVLLLFLFVGLSPVYAGWNEGAGALDRGDYKTAFQEFKPLAEHGNAGAQYNIGLMYLEGKGVTKDYVEAVKWYKKAAEQGNAEAQSNLGVMYANGLGVPQDYAEAAKWFKKAAEQGNAGAQYNIGLMYVLGEGVPKDFVMAYMWLDLAAAKGIEAAVKNRSILEKDMTPEQITEAQRLSREFKVNSP